MNIGPHHIILYFTVLVVELIAFYILNTKYKWITKQIDLNLAIILTIGTMVVTVGIILLWPFALIAGIGCILGKLVHKFLPE